MKRPPPFDPYDVLGVRSDATPEQVRAAHRRLVMQYHPDRDRSPGAAERFQRVQAAYDVLGDPDHRAEYDTHRRRVEAERQDAARRQREAREARGRAEAELRRQAEAERRAAADRAAAERQMMEERRRREAAAAREAARRPEPARRPPNDDWDDVYALRDPDPEPSEVDVSGRSLLDDAVVEMRDGRRPVSQGPPVDVAKPARPVPRPPMSVGTSAQEAGIVVAMVVGLLAGAVCGLSAFAWLACSAAEAVGEGYLLDVEFYMRLVLAVLGALVAAVAAAVFWGTVTLALVMPIAAAFTIWRVLTRAPAVDLTDAGTEPGVLTERAETQRVKRALAACGRQLLVAPIIAAAAGGFAWLLTEPADRMLAAGLFATSAAALAAGHALFRLTFAVLARGLPDHAPPSAAHHARGRINPAEHANVGEAQTVGEMFRRGEIPETDLSRAVKRQRRGSVDAAAAAS